MKYFEIHAHGLIPSYSKFIGIGEGESSLEICQKLNIRGTASVDNKGITRCSYSLTSGKRITLVIREVEIIKNKKDMDAICNNKKELAAASNRAFDQSQEEEFERAVDRA